VTQDHGRIGEDLREDLITSLENTFFSFAIKHVWWTFGKTKDLLKVIVARPSSSESEELQSESHSLPMWNLPFFLLVEFLLSIYFPFLSYSWSSSLYGQLEIKWPVLPHLKQA
jgi:hypothetical protein